MLSQRSIKPRYILLSLLLWSGLAIADTTDYIQSPYRTEYCGWFEFKKFQRGFDKDSISVALDTLEKKAKRAWHRNDSLVFAKMSLHAGNVELSHRYFLEMSLDYETEQDYWWELLMLRTIEGEYGQGINQIRDEHPGIVQFSKEFFMQKILIAKLEHSRDPKWYKSNSIFNWEIDSTLSYLGDRDLFKENVVDPVENANWVIHFLVRYFHENDPILARACCEIGVIIEGYGCLSQAYIAYSLGRHYNKRDKDILNHIKEVKAELTRKKYKIPNFRKYFPRIKVNRFSYEVLKEQIIAERADTIPLKKPLYRVEKDEVVELPFPVEYIYVFGLTLMFLLTLFFLRIRKKK